MHPILRKFIRLFNEKKFFEAHEVLEELWLITEGPSKDFYKGLIQLAAAYVHLGKMNHAGAKSVFLRSCRHLQKYLPNYEGVEIAQLLEASEPCFGTLAEAREPPQIRTLD